MVKTSDIITLLEKFAPLETAQKWDNSGWQINLNKENIKRVMLALTVTKEVVQQAIDKKCDMIISHHPVFFDSQMRIETDYVIDAIKKNIQIYSVHTNLDVAQDGTTDILVHKLGFEHPKSYNEFVKYIELPEKTSLNQVIDCVKTRLNTKTIKLINNSDKDKISTIGFCAGAGGDFIPELRNKIDLYITGDVKYHQAADANGLIVLDVGHYDSEKYSVDIFTKILEHLDLEIIVANEKDIWKFI